MISIKNYFRFIDNSLENVPPRKKSKPFVITLSGLKTLFSKLKCILKYISPRKSNLIHALIFSVYSTCQDSKSKKGSLVSGNRLGENFFITHPTAQSNVYQNIYF